MPVRGRTVAHLAGSVGGSVVGDSDLLVTDVTHDSRRAGPGTMYVALRGEPYRPPGNEPLHLGRVPRSALPHLARSVRLAVERAHLGAGEV